MADDPIPAPAYVRYLGPGDWYTLRYTIGSYRVQAEIPKGEVAAVPTYVMPLLVDADQGAWEAVDFDDALGEIVAQDRRRSAEEADWQAWQRGIQARKRAEDELREIAAGKAMAVRDAAVEARRQHASPHEVVAAAAHADVSFDEAIGEIADLDENDQKALRLLAAPAGRTVVDPPGT